MTSLNTSSAEPPESTSQSVWEKLMLPIRATLFFVVMVTSTFLIAPFILFNPKAPFAEHYAWTKVWVRWVLAALEKLCNVRYEVHGLENLPAGNGVVLCKHQSTWETFALLQILPPISYVLKRELLKIPVWGWALKSCEPIAIDRGAKSAALKQLLSQGAERLSQGRWVVLFPEGTRVAPGQRVEYAGSGGLLAKRAGCPVVPIAHNAGEFWPRHGFIKHPGVIRVRIGPAIDPAQYSAQEIVALAEQWIESQMTQISQNNQSDSSGDQ